MQNKWHKFHSSYSPITINEPNTGKSALEQDWQRASRQENEVFIDGIPLNNFAMAYNNFNTRKDVTNFFEKIILKNLTPMSAEKKLDIVNYLDSAFHQGGLMYPISAPFSTSMKEYNENLQRKEMYATLGKRDTLLYIQTTDRGFKIQEITGVKYLNGNPNPDSSVKDMVNENYQIMPDAGNDYIINYEGTIDVDFTKNTKSPSITVESNYISYGHEGIKSKLDPRTFLQQIIDFFRIILGLNQVAVVSPNTEKNNDDQEESRLSSMALSSI